MPALLRPGLLAWILSVVASAGTSASAQARERTEAGSARTALGSGANAAAPARPEDDRADEGIRLGDLPLPNRGDVVVSAAQFEPGVSLTDGGLRLRGGAAEGFGVFVDGFRLYHLRPPLALVRRAEVLASGYGVGFADLPDGVVLLTSRRGAPQAQAQIDLFRENQDLSTEGTVVDGVGFPSVVIQTIETTQVEAGASAPLLGDRLFISAALGHASVGAGGLPDPEGVLPTTPGITASTTTGALGLSFRPNRAHTIDALALLSTSGLDNGTVLGVEPPAQPTHESRVAMLGLRWTGTITQSLSAWVQASVEQERKDLEPRFCRDRPEACDSVSAMISKFPRRIVSGNGTERRRGRDTRGEVAGSLGFRTGDPARVQQQLRWLSRVQIAAARDEAAIPSGHWFESNGVQIPEARTDSLVPWTTSARQALTTFNALEDEIAVAGRVWIRPGLGLVTARLSGDDDGTVVDASAVVAALGLGWDVTGDGRTWLRGSANRRVDPGADGANARPGNVPLSQRCLWNQATEAYDVNCVRSGGSDGYTVGLPCGPTGIDDQGAPCRRPPALTRSWEVTAGVRQGLTRHTWIDLDGIYRRTSHLSGTSETNRVWNGAGSALVGYRNGRPQTVTDLWTSDDLFRRYRGVTAALGGRIAGVTGQLAYTYSQQDAAAVAASNPFGDIPGRPFYAEGDADEHRHVLRLLGTYNLLDAASFGVTYAYDSGRVLTPTSSGYGDHRAPRGVNPGTSADTTAGSASGVDPGTDINDPSDDVVLRQPAVQRLNLQARLRLGRWIPFGADLYVDVLNAFDQRSSAADLEGRWFRVGVDLRY